MMTPEIFIAGSCMIDMVSYTSEETYGGKGANQAIQCALLGIDTSFCGRLGDDDFGKDYLERFISHEINTDHLKLTKYSTTGVAHIDKDTNTLVIIPASNSLVSVQDIKEAQKEISNAKILICQNEIPHEATLKAMTIASQNNVLTIFNPAPPKPMAKLKDLLSLADIIVTNELGLAGLTNKTTTTLDEIKIAGQYLLSNCCGATSINTLVVTLGEDGAIIMKNNTLPAHIPVPQEYRMIDYTKEISDCSFIGHMANRMARGMSLTEACNEAQVHQEGLSNSSSNSSSKCTPTGDFNDDDDGADEVISASSRDSFMASMTRRMSRGMSIGEAVEIAKEYEYTESVECVDTMGAGDSFIGHLASHLARGVSMQEAVSKAVCGAALSVMKKGVQISYPSFKQLPPTLRSPSKALFEEAMKANCNNIGNIVTTTTTATAAD